MLLNRTDQSVQCASYLTFYLWQTLDYILLIPKIDEFALTVLQIIYVLKLLLALRLGFTVGLKMIVLAVPNYSLISQDKTFGRGEGIRAFVSSSIIYKKMT